MTLKDGFRTASCISLSTSKFFFWKVSNLFFNPGTYSCESVENNCLQHMKSSCITGWGKRPHTLTFTGDVLAQMWLFTNKNNALQR